MIAVRDFEVDICMGFYTFFGVLFSFLKTTI